MFRLCLVSVLELSNIAPVLFQRGFETLRYPGSRYSSHWRVLRAPLGNPALTVLRCLCFNSMCSAPPAGRLLQARMDIQPLPECYPIIAAQFGNSYLALYNATVLCLGPSPTSDIATCKVSQTQNGALLLSYCTVIIDAEHVV